MTWLRRRGRTGLLGVALTATTICVMVLTTVASSAAATPESRVAQAERHAAGNPHAYSFIATVHGKPVHWNRCDTIVYRVNRRRSPAHSLKQVKTAIRRLHRASGLSFHYAGGTKVVPGNTFRYPGHTKLVIGWSRPGHNTALPKGAAGVGGPEWLGNGEIVKSFVVLNSNVQMASGFGRGPRFGIQGTVGQVLMHELGHAVGLGHAKDQRQIMYPIATRKLARYGAGDLNGLALVGSKTACF